MSDYSSATARARYQRAASQGQLNPEWMTILEPPDPAHTVSQFRFVPPSCLSSCNTAYDHGIEHLVYLQSIITDEVD